MSRRNWNILEWTAVDKCILTAAITFPFSLILTLIAIFFREQVLQWGYMEPWGMDVGVRLLWFSTTAWFLVIAIGLAIRKSKPDSIGLVALNQYFWYLNTAVAAILMGVFTTPVIIFLIAAATVGYMLFDHRIVLRGVCLYALLVTSATIVQLTTEIPYAPLITGSPVADGEIESSWVAMVGWWTVATPMVTIIMFWYMVKVWRRQESQLADAHRDLASAHNNLAQAHDDLWRAKERLEEGTKLIKRYVPSQLAEQILEGGEESEVHALQRKKLTLFFSDIQGFTDAADRLEAEDLAGMLNEYLSAMIEIVGQHGGTLDKFVGDAIMVIFGAPVATTDEDQAIRCVRMAWDMQAKMQELKKKWFNEGIEGSFEVRMGINTGSVTVGNFGSEGHMDYTAIGTQVNLAARLEKECPPGSILISHPTWGLVKDIFRCSEKGSVEVKGIHYPVTVYEVDGFASDAKAVLGGAG